MDGLRSFDEFYPVFITVATILQHYSPRYLMANTCGGTDHSLDRWAFKPCWQAAS